MPEPQSSSGAELLGLGLSFAAAVVGPLVFGILIDAGAHTSPIGIVVGLLLGIVAGCVVMYQRFKKYW